MFNFHQTKSFKSKAIYVSEEELTQGFAEVPPSLKSSLSFWNLIFMLSLYEKGIPSAKIINAKSDKFGLVCVRYA